VSRFLLYYPLKQGLKLVSKAKVVFPKSMFLLYYPLKQGLKQLNHLVTLPLVIVFLLYYPLKQGLKRSRDFQPNAPDEDFYPTIH